LGQGFIQGDKHQINNPFVLTPVIDDEYKRDDDDKNKGCL
jgi:hypothetical protein